MNLKKAKSRLNELKDTRDEYNASIHSGEGKLEELKVQRKREVKTLKAYGLTEDELSSKIDELEKDIDEMLNNIEDSIPEDIDEVLEEV